MKTQKFEFEIEKDMVSILTLDKYIEYLIREHSSLLYDIKVNINIDSIKLQNINLGTIQCSEELKNRLIDFSKVLINKINKSVINYFINYNYPKVIEYKCLEDIIDICNKDNFNLGLIRYNNKSKLEDIFTSDRLSLSDINKCYSYKLYNTKFKDFMYEELGNKILLLNKDILEININLKYDQNNILNNIDDIEININTNNSIVYSRVINIKEK